MLKKITRFSKYANKTSFIRALIKVKVDGAAFLAMYPSLKRVVTRLLRQLGLLKYWGNISGRSATADSVYETTDPRLREAMDTHLNLIHAARLEMVATLLPQAEVILDLGGANSPLYKMGYPHRFKKLTLIDLPVEKRHEYYKDIVLENEEVEGQVTIRYSDMTNLEGIADESIDFVWSGQSIEHVPLEHGERMCREAYRVLKKGGAFCLDTPNRYLTQIHTRAIGGGFIHPEHYIEYYPEHLEKILSDTGFKIHLARGVCEMPETVKTQEFQYLDFMFGQNVSEKINDSYIQFFHCVKA